MSNIAENLKKARERIRAATLKVHKSPDNITLVAVTKAFDSSIIKEAIKLGIKNIGETKVQEAMKKQKELGNFSKKVKWHMIGHLQSNKAKDAVKTFDMIQTIDRIKIAKKISNYCVQLKKEIPVLVQVNLTGKTNGVDPDKTIQFVNEIRKLDGIQVKGLMTIAPYLTDSEKSRPYFNQLKHLAESCQLKYLSMGMSNDFNIAIEEGATIVRIGTAIFGSRSGGG